MRGRESYGNGVKKKAGREKRKKARSDANAKIWGMQRWQLRIFTRGDETFAHGLGKVSQESSGGIEGRRGGERQGKGGVVLLAPKQKI